MNFAPDIRVKIKFVSLNGTLSYCQFILDPNVTTYDNLVERIQREFCTDDDFSISYLTRDKYGEQFQSLLQSDIDLHKALSHCTDCTLRLFIEAKPKSDESWDIVSSDEVIVSHPQDASVARVANMSGPSPYYLSSQPVTPSSFPKWSPSVSTGYLASTLRAARVSGRFLQNVSQQLVKTVTSLEKVINFRSDLPSRPPLSEAEFRSYMDGFGRIVQPLDFYQNVYLRGMDASLRKVAWRILLKIYPPELSGKERMALLHSRIEKYKLLKKAWKQAYREGRLTKTQVNAITLASVDVVRTDRNHPFYHNDGKNQRISQLFSILATYAIYHPGIGYHQGMSNLASLLLYVQDGEGAAYVCLCALMRRLAPKFAPGHDQITMITQMQHLHDLLVYTDYNMAQFLRIHNLGNMFFTERWLLLELIREFPFEEALHISEVQWAAIALVASTWSDVGSTTLYSQLSTEQSSIVFEAEETHYTQCDTNLINSLVGDEFKYNPPYTAGTEKVTFLPSVPSPNRKSRESTSIHEGDPVHMKDWVVELPSPDVMGGGSNPFLLFICVSMILEYREEILEHVHEVCDLFHLFQTYNKHHNLGSILSRARGLFDAYLKDQEMKR
ncbi:TBC1 domain family member 25 [Echinococcus granulosus]|uniref:Gtpase activating protein n=1 Tax=Echinococcus granulosus TaxID=6210 RepID=U6JHI1_ECHGR|nr:TBC1 domain-containing protein [Echinococcus granulosus]EUB56695.1 TBC1 domain-containing protein [Echinococcus granulosus]KAH9286523.1 TBC1 domain family member 25 [Echinococcus granulosus]CDS22808.1 gtpase activating protein [Echinococcus granulosus]